MKHLLDDTLFKRLFLLMWAALLLSHLLGYLSFQQFLPLPGEGPWRVAVSGPALSLPPLGGPAGIGRPPPDDSAPDGVPPDMGPPGDDPLRYWVWMDYLIRTLVIGVAAWFGARWLSAPIRRLARASQSLADGMSARKPAAVLDEHEGPLEVRQTAEVFNAMSQRLHAQFGAQALLMAAISHDLRTPLSRLRLRLEHMEPGPFTERCVDDVREMDVLIGSVLEMMQLSHQTTEPQRVDLRALVQSLADDLTEQGQAVTLRDDTPEQSAQVSGHPVALGRVVDNLVSNAVRHGGSAELQLHVEPALVRVTVSDRGPGIPGGELESVFQPFYRLDASRSRQTGGSGLGLYIARDLARRHGGQVSLRNRPDGGLQAELSLPRAASH